MSEFLPDLRAIAAEILPQHPQVVFFDAVGTLFGVRGSVGAVYGEIAAEFGVPGLVAADLDRAFGQAFQTAGRPAFPGIDVAQIPSHERTWWREVVAATFRSLGVEFVEFEGFFETLFAHFATAAPWELYPETIATLEQLQQANVPLGIISNFDSRLPSVLLALEIDGFFSQVSISTLVGAAKPDPAIFQTALSQFEADPARVWHIGDSRREDFEGARAAGLQSIIVAR